MTLALYLSRVRSNALLGSTCPEMLEVVMLHFRCLSKEDVDRRLALGARHPGNLVKLQFSEDAEDPTRAGHANLQRKGLSVFIDPCRDVAITDPKSQIRSDTRLAGGVEHLGLSEMRRPWKRIKRVLRALQVEYPEVLQRDVRKTGCHFCDCHGVLPNVPVERRARKPVELALYPFARALQPVVRRPIYSSRFRTHEPPCSRSFPPSYECRPHRSQARPPCLRFHPIQ